MKAIEAETWVEFQSHDREIWPWSNWRTTVSWVNGRPWRRYWKRVIQ